MVWHPFCEPVRFLKKKVEVFPDFNTMHSGQPEAEEKMLDLTAFYSYDILPDVIEDELYLFHLLYESAMDLNTDVV